MTVELLIFDCDGVLIDSEPVASAALWQALNDAGVSISRPEVHRRFTGYSETDAHRICIEELGLAEPASVFAGLRNALYTEFARSLSPMTGMPALVRSLSVPKCVASNSDIERLQNTLGLLDLWHDFAPHIFSAEMVEAPKPAPDLFLHCAREFGIDPSRCLVIDDSAHGIIGAVAAGMRAIGFVDPADPRPNRPDVLAEAGAVTVATGAFELQKALEGLLASAVSSQFGPTLAVPA
ncbi:HAD family hydrolase [Pseudorhizobium flavum]|uniref:HAD superfamily hydrolase (TIGR01509 family) n=1 Tax=Pseudorhizobium flavum TaxID=1335061 RepID=A0A7X0DFK6_9HYPH|nr:HAD family hydrolase [Pseudorhizobium flavum]MBB6181264.1 HAD superfamily hydrolase (TIGR01509 family) [Pseudorhizobium flavum]CAD6601469.1 hydrolase [Pseudorhizobium flavum]